MAAVTIKINGINWRTSRSCSAICY